MTTGQPRHLNCKGMIPPAHIDDVDSHEAKPSRAWSGYWGKVDQSYKRRCDYGNLIGHSKTPEASGRLCLQRHQGVYRRACYHVLPAEVERAYRDIRIGITTQKKRR